MHVLGLVLTWVLDEALPFLKTSRKKKKKPLSVQQADFDSRPFSAPVALGSTRLRRKLLGVLVDPTSSSSLR
jgi:hypothetical protein